MADRKISELTNITGANLADDDEFALVDTSADETKAITFGEFKTALDTATGFVRITGDTMTGNLSMGDNVKAIFGAGSDLQIYHDGAHSYISDQGTGNLRILADNLYINNAANTQNYISGISGAQVRLYYNGDIKLQTTSTGIDVTGTAVMDGLTVDGFGSVSSGSSGVAPYGDFFIEDDANAKLAIASPNTHSGFIDFGDPESSSAGRLEFNHPTDAFYFSTQGTSRLKLAGNVAVFNDAGADTDFRVESDSNANMLFVDASRDVVGVGTGSPVNTDSPSIQPGFGNVVGLVVGYQGLLGHNCYYDGGNWRSISTFGGSYDWSAIRQWDGIIRFHTGEATYSNQPLSDMDNAAEKMRITKSGVTINENSRDQDFRVESDSQTHMLFVDAANNRVGIGTNGPESTLSVDGDILSNWGNSGQQKIGIAARGGNVFSTTGRTLILTGADAIAGSQAMAGGDVIVRGGKGRANTGLNTYAGHLYLEGGEHTTSGETSGAGNVYIKTAGNVRASFYAGGDVAIPSTSANEFFKIDHSANDLMVGTTGSNDGGTLTLGESGQATYSVSANEGMAALVRFNNTGNANQHSGIMFRVTSNNGSNNSNASIGAIQTSSGSHNTRFYFNVRSQTQNKIRQYGHIDSENGWVFNDAGESYIDFRVESDNQSNMLKVDAAEDCVIIGGGSPIDTVTYFSLQGISNGDAGEVKVRTNGKNAFKFRNSSNGVVGSITLNTSGTTYNTTSDRRLKDNIEPIADGTEKLMALKPVTHTWKAEPEADAVHGFIAQEMMDIVPEAVSGDPDGEEMMAMDYGRITPVLVAALQDAHNKITALETRLAELETK